MNYSCPDINALPELNRSPSPNLSKFSNNNFSRSCPNINALLNIKDGSINRDNFNDIANSCPNISDMRNNYICGMPKKRASSSESTDILDDSYDSFDRQFDRDDDYFHKKSISPNNFETFSPLARCIFELDMLKNEVNEIKNECECLLYECTCQQRKKNFKDYKMVHYDTPIHKNPLKLLPTKTENDKTKRLNRKISFTNLPYTPRSDYSNPTYNRTNSEPNLLKNAAQFRTYNRSCSDVGKIINKNSTVHYNTQISSEEYLEHNKYYEQRFGSSSDALRPNSLSVTSIKSDENLDTFGTTYQNTPKQKLLKKSPKKHDISPTDILRNKMKQSLSMFDLNATKTEQKYDNYHTIHGGMKLPKEITDFTLKNYKNQSDDLHSSWVGQKSLVHNNENLLAVVKCCCGDPNCQKGRIQLVPITFQQLLDSNLSSDMVRCQK